MASDSTAQIVEKLRVMEIVTPEGGVLHASLLSAWVALDYADREACMDHEGCWCCNEYITRRDNARRDATTLLHGDE